MTLLGQPQSGAPVHREHTAHTDFFGSAESDQVSSTHRSGIIAPVTSKRIHSKWFPFRLDTWRRRVRAVIVFAISTSVAAVIGDYAIRGWTDVARAVVTDRGTNTGRPNVGCVGGTTGGGPNTAAVSDVDIEFRVALPGECLWSSDRSPLAPRDYVNLLLTYRNSSTKIQRDVDVWTALRSDIELVPKSTMIYNSNYPNGLEAGTEAIGSNGILIGSYAPGAVAYVRFSVVLPAGSLSCGESVLHPAAFVRPAGMSAHQKSATVTVYKRC